MTHEELENLINEIRQQSSTWMGDEACEKIERLIAHTLFLRARHDSVQQMIVDGFRMVKPSK